MEFASDITRVPFGRTDVLIGANDAPSPELSYGHDLKRTSFHGLSKEVFFYFAAIRDRKIEKTKVGVGRTELSLRLSCTEFCALSSGHGPRGQGFEGFSKTLDFHDLFWGSKMEKNMKMQDEHGQISISGALDPRNMIS